MPKLGLNRQQLKAFLPDHQAIIAFENILSDVSSGIPSTIEEANAHANTAISMAQEALSALVEVAAELAALLSAPGAQDALEPDDTAPRVPVGTLGEQNSSAVDITGGTIGLDAGTVSAPSFYLVDATTGLYRPSANTWGMSIAGINLITYSATGAVFAESVETAKQLKSTIATGTPPLVIASTTKVTNLNVDLLDGADWASPGAIGTTAPNSVAATTVAASGQITSTVASGTAPLVVASTTKVANLNADQVDGGDWAAPGALGSTTPNSAIVTTLTASGLLTNSSGQITIARNLVDQAGRRNWGWMTESVAVGDLCLYVSASNNTSAYAGTLAAQWTAAGFRSVAGFGCNTKTPQGAFALGAASTDLPTVIALANNIRLALIANGIGS